LRITYNGEVYNFRELRRELEALGHRFRSDTDTEVVLNAYRQWGPQSLSRLNGMFAFAVWDERDHSLFVARDRLGVKPLYYSTEGGGLRFASEIKSLLEDPSLPRDIDWEAVDLYLTFRIIPHPFTIFRGVRKLAPGHYLVLKDGRLSEREYWDVFGERGRGAAAATNGSALRNGNLGAAKRELFALTEDAVRRRLVSDVPVGVLLSGGIDSSIIASLAARLSPSRMKTFTLGFLDAKKGAGAYDESETARRTAAFLGTEHHELLLTTDAVRESIPGVLDHFDEPFGSSSAVPMFHISRLARESVTVALSGDGPDETFAGYRAYLLEPLASVYMRLPRALSRSVIEPAVFGLPSSDASTLARSVRRAQRFLRAVNAVPSERFFRLTNKFNDMAPEDVYDPAFRTLSLELARRVFRRHYDAPALGADLINRMLYVDAKIKLADHVLTKVDMMSMRVSLEVRTPFLDYRIAELAFRLPGNAKVNWLRKKFILRETFRQVLPPHVFRLPKRGFEIPVGEWFKNELREMFLDTVAEPAGGGVFRKGAVERLYEEHRQGKRDHGEKLWILFVLRWWARKNGVRI
ncbi:MAG TPA: asparagine synthase (glutamine-hydrolyzing), partial [Pyrinomonadaceae bacterium]|nr:asparagine synthase (glutamine-hydrolyzing) [Pyrinomonadaceae bacterium]